MYKLLSISVLALFLLTSCKKYDKFGHEIVDYDELHKADWLLGEWEKADSLGTLTEKWAMQDDSTFTGESYYIVNKNDTVHSEKIELMEDQQHLIYTATVKGQNNDEPIPFQMTKDDDSLLIFENPKHDFPNRIQYKLNKNNSITATVSGKQLGKIETDSYNMIKKK